MDINDLTEDDGPAIAVALLKPGRMLECVARSGMALQPDEDWVLVLDQIDTETEIELIRRLATGALAGRDELAKVGQDDAAGESPETAAA